MPAAASFVAVAGLLLAVGPALRWGGVGTGGELTGRLPSAQRTPGSLVDHRPATTDPAPRASGRPTSATPPAAPPKTRAAAARPPLVPESRPLRLEAPAIGLKAAVSAYTAADVRRNGGVVRPSSLWDVAWWTGGGTPGTKAQNTVYLYGHTWKEPAVFNRLKELEAGDEVYVTTTRGRLRYVVEGAFTVSKPQLPTHERVVAAVPGRLLLLGCYRQTGKEERTSRNIVITAQLGQPTR